MSGSETISISGVPARLRSMPVSPGRPSCKRLARVFFEVRARDADAPRAAVVEHDVDVPAGDDRQFVLADLVALGQVGIEIILAGEHRARRDPRADREPEHHRHAHRLAVEHRQHARVAEVDQVGLRIGRRTKGGGRARENLRARRQLRVDFQPDDGFPRHFACDSAPSAIRLRRAPSASRSRAGSGAPR